MQLRVSTCKKKAEKEPYIERGQGRNGKTSGQQFIPRISRIGLRMVIGVGVNPMKQGAGEGSRSLGLLLKKPPAEHRQA